MWCRPDPQEDAPRPRQWPGFQIHHMLSAGHVAAAILEFACARLFIRGRSPILAGSRFSLALARSKATSSAAVGVWIPLSWARRTSICRYPPPVSHRTMLFMAAPPLHGLGIDARIFPFEQMGLFQKPQDKPQTLRDAPWGGRRWRMRHRKVAHSKTFSTGC